MRRSLTLRACRPVRPPPQEEFWTAAVQPGKALTVTQKDEDDVTTHITQVALGPTKSAEPVTVTIDVNGESHTLGTLIKGVVTEFSVRSCAHRIARLLERRNHMRALSQPPAVAGGCSDL